MSGPPRAASLVTTAPTGADRDEHRKGVRAMDMAVLAGSLSTAVFVGSTLPMLTKALRTRDVSSYSRGNLVLATAGNGLYAFYVFSLPPGPLWVLHLFHTLATGFMLVWHVRYADLRSHALDSGRSSSANAAAQPASGMANRNDATTPSTHSAPAAPAETMSSGAAHEVRRQTRTASQIAATDHRMIPAHVA